MLQCLDVGHRVGLQLQLTGGRADGADQGPAGASGLRDQVERPALGLQDRARAADDVGGLRADGGQGGTGTDDVGHLDRGPARRQRLAVGVGQPRRGVYSLPYQSASSPAEGS